MSIDETHQTQAEPAFAAQQPVERDQWIDEDEELPPRPRRRLLTPVPLALLGVLLLACGFIGGVLVEKGEGGSSTGGASGSSLASRFAALRGGSSAIGKTGAAGAAAGGFAGLGAGGSRPVSGSVSYVDGHTLYITNSEGNTVKVLTSAGTTVTKSVSSTVPSIHPGETVSVRGSSGSSGALTAESITVGSAAGGGLSALFGSAAGGTGTAASSSSGGAPALFGGG